MYNIALERFAMSYEYLAKINVPRTELSLEFSCSMIFTRVHVLYLLPSTAVCACNFACLGLLSRLQLPPLETLRALWLCSTSASCPKETQVR